MSYMGSWMAGILAAVLCAGSLTAAETGKKSAFDKPTLEAYVRHLFLWGPQISVHVSGPTPSIVPGMLAVTVRATAGAASKEETFYVTKDGQKIMRAAVYDISENPFQPELAKLKTEFQPSIGTPGAPVVLVLFSDFECAFCRQEAKTLRQHLLSAYPTQVRLYFKDFPLTQIHPWAKMAAIAGRCVYRQDQAAFWDYHDWIYDHQSEITPENLKAKVLEFAKTKNLDVLQLSRCLDTRATEADVDKSIAEGRALQVNATPTLFVNGRRIASQIPWNNLRQVIDFEIDYQKTAKNAGDEACCEVKLPTPLSR
jgi:protein-disulfide isomerase